MKNLKFYTGFTAMLVIAAGMFFVSGCKKDDDNKTAPALPPQAGFVMNFNDFSNSKYYAYRRAGCTGNIICGVVQA